MITRWATSSASPHRESAPPPHAARPPITLSDRTTSRMRHGQHTARPRGTRRETQSGTYVTFVTSLFSLPYLTFTTREYAYSIHLVSAPCWCGVRRAGLRLGRACDRTAARRSGGAGASEAACASAPGADTYAAGDGRDRSEREPCPLEMLERSFTFSVFTYSYTFLAARPQ